MYGFTYVPFKLTFSDKAGQWLPEGEVGEVRDRQEERINRHMWKLEDGRYVHCLDCGDGSLVLCLAQNLSNCTLYICIIYCTSIIIRKCCKKNVDFLHLLKNLIQCCHL